MRSTLNPVWNHDLTFATVDGDAPRATLFVFSKNDYLNDSLLGKCVVTFEKPAFESDAPTQRLLAKTWLAIARRPSPETRKGPSPRGTRRGPSRSPAKSESANRSNISRANSV